MHGDVRGSLILNPWMLVVLAQAIAISGAFLFLPEKARTWWNKNDFMLVKVNLMVAGLFWVGRLAAGTIPLPFS